MTLWASRDGQQVVIHGNVGLSVKVENGHSAGYTVSEDIGQMRSLWGSLGRLLEEADAEAPQPPVHEPTRGGF